MKNDLIKIKDTCNSIIKILTSKDYEEDLLILNSELINLVVSVLNQQRSSINSKNAPINIAYKKAFTIIIFVNRYLDNNDVLKNINTIDQLASDLFSIDLTNCQALESSIYSSFLSLEFTNHKITYLSCVTLLYIIENDLQLFNIQYDIRGLSVHNKNLFHEENCKFVIIDLYQHIIDDLSILIDKPDDNIIIKPLAYFYNTLIFLYNIQLDFLHFYELFYSCFSDIQISLNKKILWLNDSKKFNSSILNKKDINKFNRNVKKYHSVMKNFSTPKYLNKQYILIHRLIEIINIFPNTNSEYYKSLPKINVIQQVNDTNKLIYLTGLFFAKQIDMELIRLNIDHIHSKQGQSIVLPNF